MICNIRTLPEGTPVRVNLREDEYPKLKERFIEGTLTFQTIPDEYFIAMRVFTEQYDMDEDWLEHEQPEVYSTYKEFKDEFEFGITHKQPYDYNVEPRDIGQPTCKKGTVGVCYEYSALRYELIK